jgi:hypothetical protein
LHVTENNCALNKNRFHNIVKSLTPRHVSIC